MIDFFNDDDVFLFLLSFFENNMILHKQSKLLVFLSLLTCIALLVVANAATPNVNGMGDNDSYSSSEDLEEEGEEEGHYEPEWYEDDQFGSDEDDDAPWYQEEEESSEDESDSEDEDLDEEEEEVDELLKHKHRCRDDAYMNCTKVLESGDCDLSKTGPLQRANRKICPVTCGLCSMPSTSKVWLDHNCYQHSEDIVVHFNNSDPDPWDYIGIYPASHDFTKNPDLLVKAPLWLTCCGGLHEYCKTARGSLLFGGLGPTDQATWNFFPLAAGEYKAVLARGEDPHELIVESEPFVAKPQGHSCYDECKDLIYTGQECYNSDTASIHVTFENCKPEDNDAIAIYHEGETPGGTNQPLLWLGACGSQECMGKVSYDILVFGPKPPNEAGRLGWPLPEGNYKAYLMKGSTDGGNYGTPSAETLFSIKGDCEPDL